MNFPGRHHDFDATMAKRVVGSISTQFQGSSDHRLLAKMISCAPKVVLDSDVTNALVETYIANPATIERNLDLARLPANLNSVWIEMPLDVLPWGEETNEDGSSRQIRSIGFFIARDPEDSQALLVYYFQETESLHINVGQAVIVLETDYMGRHAVAARSGLSSDPMEARTRVMLQVNVEIPKMFFDAISILCSDANNSTLQSMLDGAKAPVARSAGFLMAVLVAINSNNLDCNIDEKKTTFAATLCKFKNKKTRKPIKAVLSDFFMQRSRFITPRAKSVGFIRSGNASILQMPVNHTIA